MRGDVAGQAYVFEPNGRILVQSNDNAPDTVASLAERPELALLLQLAEHGTSADYQNFAGQAVFGTAAPIGGTDLIIVTEVPTPLTEQASRSALTLLVAGLLVFGAVTMGLAGLLLGRLIFQPLTVLQRGAAAIADGDMTMAVPVRRQDELGQVATAFNLMAEAVRTREQRLHDLAESLEQQVIVRTADLRRESEERQRLQAETLRQAEAIVALSTPLIPVSDELLVLPVIGTLDQQRLTQLQATLLAGIERQQSGAVILDLTGVVLIDADGAAGLLALARMAALLGVRSILTGVGPEVAQALVSLDARLDQFRTYSTLQEAIAVAFQSQQLPVRTAARQAQLQCAGSTTYLVNAGS